MFQIEVAYFSILRNFYLNQNLYKTKIHRGIQLQKYKTNSIKNKLTPHNVASLQSEGTITLFGWNQCEVPITPLQGGTPCGTPCMFKN